MLMCIRIGVFGNVYLLRHGLGCGLRQYVRGAAQRFEGVPILTVGASPTVPVAKTHFNGLGFYVFPRQLDAEHDSTGFTRHCPQVALLCRTDATRDDLGTLIKIFY